jgi:hypothetical protein
MASTRARATCGKRVALGGNGELEMTCGCDGVKSAVLLSSRAKSHTSKKYVELAPKSLSFHPPLPVLTCTPMFPLHMRCFNTSIIPRS